MRTVQMTLEPDLVEAVDHAAEKLKTTRSGFTRSALIAALKNIKTLDLEKKHRAGYLKSPAATDETEGWEKEQVGPVW